MFRNAGRPEYQHLKDDVIRAKAAELCPTDEACIPRGVEEVLQSDIDEILSHATTDKAATPVERTWFQEDLRRDMDRARPQNLVSQRDSDANRNVPASQLSAFSDTSTLNLRTGSNLIDQFRSEYIPEVFGLTFRWRVGGPDFTGGRTRYRRSLVENAPFVSLKEFTSMTVARVESQFRWDWDLLPALYSLNFASEVNLSTSLAIKRCLKRGNFNPEEPVNVGKAAMKIYKVLWNGLSEVEILNLNILKEYK